jgi:hypothetical protein
MPPARSTMNVLPGTRALSVPLPFFHFAVIKLGPEGEKWHLPPFAHVPTFDTSDKTPDCWDCSDREPYSHTTHFNSSPDVVAAFQKQPIR